MADSFSSTPESNAFFPDQFELALLQHYLCYGLESTLFFLRKHFAKLIPISQINIIALTRDFHLLIPVCSTNPTCSIQVESNLPGEPPRYLLPDRPLDAVLVENDLSPYKTKYLRSFSVAGTSFVGSEALLRIPLYSVGDQVYVIQLWSQQRNVFSAEKVKIIIQVIAPLCKVLESDDAAIAASKALLEFTQVQSAGYEKLARCFSLTKELKKVSRVAVTATTVLITGETGVGKESVADAVYELSNRKNGPFVKVNCGGLPESLVDSELFGHEKGSFTGAHTSHIGYFEQAHSGTLFLDEVAELPLSAQVKLLRILDSKSFYRVGATKPCTVDVRLIAATNRDLTEMVLNGKFRKDLYYRLSVYPLHIPPLSERQDDIFPLAFSFLESFAKQMGKQLPFVLRKHDIAAFYRYPWPGNVRELKNVVERAMINYVSGTDLSELHFELIPSLSIDNRAKFFPQSDWPTLADLEERYITAVIERMGGKMSGPDSASSVLGIHYTTLRAHLRKKGRKYRQVE